MSGSSHGGREHGYRFLLEDHARDWNRVPLPGVVLWHYTRKVLLTFLRHFCFLFQIFLQTTARAREKDWCRTRVKNTKNAEWCWAPWSAWARVSESLPPSLIHYLIKLPILSFPHTHTPLPIYNTRQRAFSCITPIQEKKLWKDFNDIKEKQTEAITQTDKDEAIASW